MKIKALAAAVALMSTASVANAAWHDGSDFDTFSFNGELVLVAFDDVRKVSVVQDLGGSYDEIYDNIGNGSFTKGFILNPLFASTFAASTAGNVQWTVFANAGNNFGITPDVQPGSLITSNVLAGNSGHYVSNSEWDGAQNKVDTSVSNYINGGLGDAFNFALNGAFLGNASNGLFAGDDFNFGSKLQATLPFDTTSITDTAYFWLIPEGSSTGNEQLEVKIGTWNLNIASGSLQYAAVPVPAAVWLLASGLLGLGAVSRRRKA